MKYSDLLSVVQTLNTGSLNPENIDLIIKLVLGKMSRVRLRSQQKVGQITTNGLTQFTLGTATFLPDFIDINPDVSNNNLCVFYLDGNNPQYLKLVNESSFRENQNSFVCTLLGKTLKIGVPSGMSVPATLNIPYFSSYLILDQDGVTFKDKPENSDDEIVIPPTFDDILVDGILLYISRREKDAEEFTKNLREWQNGLADALFYM